MLRMGNEADYGFFLKYLNTDEMITVIVGDKKKYMSEIKNLGYSVIEIDADGAAIDINKTN